MESLMFPGNDDHELERCSALALAGDLCFALGVSSARLHIETEAGSSNSQEASDRCACSFPFDH